MFILDLEEFKLIVVVKKISVNHELQPSLLKQEMKHNEYYEDTWEAKENELLPYVENDVLSTAFCYARYQMGVEKLTNFSMKNSLTLTSLANENFKLLKDEKDEPIYTYSYPFMKNFVPESVKGGRCNTFNQHYLCEISDEVFIIISKN